MTPDEIVSQVVLNNYGPEGDAELYEVSIATAVNGVKPMMRELLDNAAWMRDLNGDGVYALMRAAVEADRAQRERTLVVLAHREVWVNDAEAEVLDADYLLGFGDVDETPEEIAAVVAKLRSHGWESIADDVETAEKERAE